MKTILQITIVLIVSFHLLTSNFHAQSPIDSVGSGCSLEFNGASNFVNIPHNNSLNFGPPGSTYSISVWVKTSLGGPILSKSRPSSVTNMPYVLSVDNLGKVVFLRWYQPSGGLADTFTSNTVVNDNEWHHIVFVNESSSMHKIYIDGVLDVQDNTLWTTNDSNTEPIYVGKYHNYTWEQLYINGEIDEIRIWNYSRTQTEIQRDMCQKLRGTEVGLVDYWQFDDCGGTTVTDASGNGNTGTLN